MNREKTFKEILKLITNSEVNFKNFEFNPFQIFISEIYIDAINNKNVSKYKKLTYNPFSDLFLKINKLRYNTKFTSKLDKYKFLFFPVEITHVKQMKPIWDYLDNLGVSYLICTNRKKIYKVIHNNPSNKILILYSKKFKGKLKYKYLNEIKKILEKSELSNNLKLIIYSIISSRIDSVLSMHTEINQFLKNLKDIIVFPGNDTTLEGRLLVEMSKRRKIFTTTIMHGSVTGEFLDTYHQVDRFFIFGDAARKDLISKGVDSRKLFVSGSPYTNKILDLQKNNFSLYSLLKNYKKDLPNILIAHSGPGNSTSFIHYQKFLKNLFRLIRANKKFNWVIKLHRKDTIDNFKKALDVRDFSDYNIIDSNHLLCDKNIYDWFNGCNLLITGNSSTSLEAMLFSIPVITADFNNEYKQVDFIDLNTTYHAKNYKEFSAFFQDIVINKKLDFEIKKNAKEYSKTFYHIPETRPEEIIVKNLLKELEKN